MGTRKSIGTQFITDEDPLQVAVEVVGADARQGALVSSEVTLSGTPGTVSSVTLPDSAQGFRIFPRSNAVRFAIGEDPAAVGTGGTFTVGGVAKADAWETRTLDAGASRTLRLRSTVASVVIDVEAW